MIYDPGGTPIVDVEGTDINDVEGTDIVDVEGTLGDAKVFRSGGKVVQVSWSAATNSLLAYSGG